LLRTSDNSHPADPGHSCTDGRFPVPHDADRVLTVSRGGGQCPSGRPASVAPGPPAMPHARPRQTRPDPQHQAACSTLALPGDARGSPTAARGSGEGTPTAARAPRTSPCPPHRAPHAGSAFPASAAGRGTGTALAQGRWQLPSKGWGQAGAGLGGDRFRSRGLSPPWLGAFLGGDPRVPHARTQRPAASPSLRTHRAPRRRGGTGREPRQREAASAELLSAVLRYQMNIDSANYRPPRRQLISLSQKDGIELQAGGIHGAQQDAPQTAQRPRQANNLPQN